MKADNPALTEAAACVADGVPVDWPGTEARADAHTRRLVRHLRLVESISALYRSLPDQSDAPPPQPPVEPTGVRWGQLLRLDRIGEGTSGDVFRAWDSELHREVALKLLREDAAADREAHARVLEEARRLARVRHPHVLQVYGAEQHDNQVGLWTELVRGESLEEIVKTRGPFGPREAAVVGLDLCAAIAAVHGAGLLHRDIKAQNVLREEGGRIVLMDFGTGEDLRSDGGTSGLLGTPLYLAPELFRGEAASVQSDLYSLGVLLFFLVTGAFPIRAASIAELPRAHESGRFRRLRDLRPDVPQGFVAVVERALSSNPAHRYGSAGEMEAALRESLDASRLARPVRSVIPVASRRAPSIVLSAALLLVVTALILWMRGSQEPGGFPVIQRIAVLPIVELSGSSAPPLFADGLTDQLISTLGQISALQVKPWSSVAGFKDSTRPLAEIAAQLHADALLETTLLAIDSASGGPARVRVNTRLIAAGGDVQIWARTFERPMGEMVALQAAIARDIAHAVDAAITPEETTRLRQRRRTTPAAEEAFFQGRAYLARYGTEARRHALEAFRRAIELDPTHAAAHAGAAQAYFMLGFGGALSQPEARALAWAEAQKALALDRNSPEAHVTVADLKFYYDWDWAEAEAGYLRSLDTNPSFTYARTQYAQFLAAGRRLEEAVEQSAAAARLDTLSADAGRIHGLVLYYQRDFAAAESAVRRSLEIDPQSPGAWAILGRIAEAEGRVVDGLELTKRAVELSHSPPVFLRVQLMRLQALTGKEAEARQGLRALEEELAANRVEANPQFAAYIALALGDHQAALDRLEEAVGRRYPTLLWLAVDPRMDPLREHARFQRILVRLGLY